MKMQSGSKARTTSTSADARVLVLRVPLGVVGVVSPWNSPYTMGAEVFAPALAAGNTVLWNPSSSTSACSALLEVIAGWTSARRLQLPSWVRGDRR